MKKLTCLFLIVSMMASFFVVPSSVFAQDVNFLVAESFNEQPTGAVPGNSAIAGGGARILVTQENKDKGVQMSGFSGESSIYYPAVSDENVLSMYVDLEYKDTRSYTEFYIADTANKSFVIAYINEDGQVCSSDTRFSVTVPKDRQTSVQLNYNKKRQKLSIYVGGKLVVANRFMGTGAFSEITGFGVKVKGVEGASCLLDNFAVFEGDIRIKNSDIPKKSFSLESELTSSSDGQNDFAGGVEEFVGDTVFVSRTFDETDVPELENVTLNPRDKKNKDPMAFNDIGIAKSVFDGNKYLRLEKKLPLESYISFGASQTARNVVVEMDLSTDGSTPGGRISTRDGEAANMFCTFLNIGTDSVVTDTAGTVVCKLKPLKWSRVAIAINMNDYTYDVYHNGELVSKEVGVPNTTLTGLPEIRVYCDRKDNIGTILVDNIRSYEGKEPRVIDSTERKSKVVPTSVAKGYLGSAKAIMPYVSTYYTNQNKYEAKHEMILENDDTVVYVHEEELKAMFGANAVLASPHATEAGYYNILETATANKYLIESYDTRLHMFSKTPMGLPEENAKEVMRYMFSVRPTAADLLELYKKSDNYGKHPRLLIDGEDLERIKSLYKTDPLMQEWGKNVIEAANKIFGQDDYTYPITTGSMDQVNYSMDDIVNLCLAYHLTGNERYVGRTWRFLKTICDLPHWNPGGYLDVGELSYIVGLGYDWLYHQFTPQQRAYIEKALYDKGVHLTYRMYFRELDNKEPEYYVGWWDSEVNWNAVCNGGTMCGAIALLDVYPEVASVMIENANRALEYMMPSYYPAGAWDEGGGYWNYALGYVVRIITTFRNAFGTDFNLAKTPGLSNTGWFGSKLAGSTGAYTFGDTASELVTSPHMLWLANEYNDPALAGQRLYELSRTDLFVSNGGGYNEMIYYDPETVGDAPEPELDTYVEGMEAIGFREAWYDIGAAYIGATGGKAIRGHGHIDVGSFAIDMGGERFIMDPGADKYGADGYFDRRRYNFYRTRPEGHNMYVINYEYDNPNYTGVNTNSDEGYNPSCKAEILVSKPRGGIGKIDLTPLYNKWATSAVRGYMLSDHRRSVTVRDEIDLIEPNSEVIYSLHTRAKIEKVSDNQIVLDQNGKKMLITLVTNGEVQYFDEAEAKTLSNVITAPDVDNRSVGMRKIMLKLIGNGRLNISVKFKQYDDTMVDDSPIDADISTWTIPDGEVVPIPEVDNIYIEGKPVEDFDSKVTGYKYLLPTLQEKAPEVTVDSKYKYEVIPAQDPEGDTLVKVYADESDDVYRVYRIDFWKKPPLADIDGMRRYPVDKITASAIPEPQNGPDNTIDGDFSTRWASQSTDIDPEQWLMYELADVYPIEKIGVAWMNGTTRRYIYKLEISTDGKNWTTVFDGQGSGTTGDCEYTYLNGQKAKYVRYKGYGSDTDGGYNRWNSIVEIEILGNQR